MKHHRLILLSIAAFLFIPGCITLDFYMDRIVLHRAMDPPLPPPFPSPFPPPPPPPPRRFFTKTSCLSTLFAAILLMAIAPVAQAQDITVCPSGCGYTTPEAAVNDPARVDGDTILITQGTYVLGSTLQVNNSITILANNSVFDADGRRAIEVTGQFTNVSMTNVTIRNGVADASGGGALRISDGATVTVINGIFEDNEANFGGAIHNNGSNLTLRESVLTRNRATTGDGGAVLTDNGGFTQVIRTEVDSNQAVVAGGGLAAAGGGLEFLWSTVSKNARSGIGVVGVSNDVADPLWIQHGFAPLPDRVLLRQSLVPKSNTLSAYEFEIRGLSSALGEGTVLAGRVLDIQNGYYLVLK